MMNIPGMVRRAFTVSTNSAPPESTQSADTLTDTSRDSVEASNISTPGLLESNVVSTAPSELEASKELELSQDVVTETFEKSILATPTATVETPSIKLRPTPVSISSEPRRSGRDKKLVATYNASILSGNAVHTRRAFRSDEEYSLAQVSRSTAHITMVNQIGEWIDGAGQPFTPNVVAPPRPFDDSLPKLEADGDSEQPALRKSGRLEKRITASLIAVKSVTPKQDTPVEEFARSLRPRKRPASTEPEDIQITKKTRASEAVIIEVNKEPVPVEKPKKKWLAMGLYAGQSRLDSKRKANSSKAERAHLPLPMFTGNLLLNKGRAFVLPYEILNPLPKNEAPVWTNLRKNRFVGDALPTWKKKDHSTQSTCNCTMDTKCDNNCLNRSMRYECNEENCRVGAEYCQNRSFHELTWRTKNKNLTRDPEKKESNMWGVGVEVIKTENRGCGVRAMRSFEPYQAICEYTGEIITQDEADRRMNEDYKGKTDYYLMTFHEGLIIDATKGSICRFVNHSCDPNCHVEKWVVNGEPRMALFANENGIEVGEELTYDYNFAPYSEKNLQKCLCGAESCRGVLGPRSFEQKIVMSKNGSKQRLTLTLRTPSLSPKKKPMTKAKSPARPTPTRRHTAPAVGPVSKSILVNQQKSRAERALNRADPKKGRRARNKKVNVVVPTLTKRQKSLKTANAASARAKQIRRNIAVPTGIKKIRLNVNTKPAPKKRSKNFSADPFDFPDSPPSPFRVSGRQSKPSPKARENTISNLAAKLQKTASSPSALRRTVSTSNIGQRSVTSTPTSRISNRVIIPSPKVRENAEADTSFGSSGRNIPGERVGSGAKHEQIHRVSLGSSSRRPLGTKHNA